MRVELGEVVVRREWDGPGEALEEDAAQRVDIRACVHAVTAGLLGRDVIDRADERPGASQAVTSCDSPRESEVRQVDVLAPDGGGDENVGWLHVAMDEPVGVRGVERLGYVIDDRGG